MPESDAPPSAPSRRWIVLSALLGVVAIAPFCRDGLHRYSHLTLRAKLSEAAQSLEWVRDRQAAHQREHGAYLAAPPLLMGRPGPGQQDVQLPEGSPWRVLGWEEARARCQLEVERVISAQGEEDFLATARCDVDGDGIPVLFIARRDLPPARLTAEGVY